MAKGSHDEVLTVSREDWLLAETVRLAEERAGRPFDEPAADTAGRAAGGGLDRRIVARARALAHSGPIRADIRRLQGLARGLFWLLVAAGAISGVLAAGVAAGGGERRVDLLLALAALAGLPTLMLVLWLLVLAFGRHRPGGGIPGALLRAGCSGLARRLLQSELRHDLVSATAGLLAAGGTARWTFSLLTHLFWTAYGAGALAALVVLFSVLQYDLAWGTTLLSESTVVAGVQALAQLPALLTGMEIPAAERILAARQGLEPGADRGLWAGFLVTAVAAYGLAPRILLAALSAWLLRRSGTRLALDTDLPGYLRLAPVLWPSAEVSPPDRTRAETQPPTLPERREAGPASGQPILVGVELERDPADWPPEIPGIEPRALGRADDREQARALAAALRGMRQPPPALIALCSLCRTPDAGTGRLLSELADAAASPLMLVMDEAGRLAERGGDVAARFGQWQELARRLGAEAVLLDTAAPRAGDLARLRQALDGGDP